MPGADHFYSRMQPDQQGNSRSGRDGQTQADDQQDGLQPGELLSDFPVHVHDFHRDIMLVHKASGNASDQGVVTLITE